MGEDRRPAHGALGLLPVQPDTREGVRQLPSRLQPVASGGRPAGSGRYGRRSPLMRARSHGLSPRSDRTAGRVVPAARPLPARSLFG